MVAALVLLCAVVSAGTGLGGSVAALDDPAAGSGQAPEWPFRGIVHNVYSESDGHPVLRYWSTATGEVSDVRLGPQTWCPVPLEVHAGTGILATYGHSFARYFVPWGDEAYPVIRGLDFGRDAGENPGPGLDRSFLEGRLEISDDDGRLRLATPREEAFYGGGPDGLHVIDPPSGEVSEVGAEERELFGPWEELLGTDGFYYGLSVAFDEPACQFEWSLLMAGDTGKVVACDFAMGPAMGGLTFVLPEGSPRLVDEFSLPRPYQGECEGLDLRTLPPPRAAGEARQ